MDLYPNGSSPDAELVLAAIGRELHGRTPTPALLDDLAPLYRARSRGDDKMSAEIVRRTPDGNNPIRIQNRRATD